MPINRWVPALSVNFGPEDELFGLGASYSRMRYGINDKDSFNLPMIRSGGLFATLGYAQDIETGR